MFLRQIPPAKVEATSQILGDGLSRSPPRQLHTYPVKPAADPDLVFAPAHHGQAAGLAEQARFIGVGGELDLDGVAGGQRMVHLQHQPGIAVIHQTRRDGSVVGKAFFHRTPTQRRLSRRHSLVAHLRKPMRLQMKHRALTDQENM